MLQLNAPADFIIATGRQNSLIDFCAMTFEELGLDWHDHVKNDTSLSRPLEISANLGDSTRATHILGWKARMQLRDVIRRMVAYERAPGPNTAG
jgi:GDPmannose 4,6-dehydratase